ncbi:MAG TPA: beta-xylosidase [Magnetospirillaceae bacterium]
MSARDAVRIDIATHQETGPLSRFWSWFGYDEPNYTTMPYGRKLLRDLADLSPGPVYIRAHNLLTSGDGTPALKWGSTGVYDSIAVGEPDYAWAILDRIFDAYAEAGVTPFVQLGFMPRGLSVAPEPYQHDFPRAAITTGWAHPPTDYDRWGALISAVARHFIERYGLPRVQSWPWELWNEPDGLYWRGTMEDFCRLYEVTGTALRRVLPEARLGGPHTCGPFSTKSGAPFLRKFLEHCDRAAAEGRNLPLDFIAYHAKGKPTLVDGRVRMGLSTQLRDIATGLDIIGAFPRFAQLPVILGESDPEGCAACPATTNPENAYRDGPLYAAYTAEQLFRTQEIAARADATIEGAVTWAFEFENTPFFAGYRELATNGIAKPVLNVFRMLGMMGTTRLRAMSSGARTLDDVLSAGVRGEPDINVWAARDAESVTALVWHYHDDDMQGDERAVELGVHGVADGMVCEHYRIDARHSNAHTAWRNMGAPQKPNAEQYAALERAAVLQPSVQLASRRAADGSLRISFTLPRQAVSLIVLRQASR